MGIGDVVILSLPVLLLLLLLQRTRKQQREVAQAQAAIAPGRRVMMASGLYGEVVTVPDDGTVVLEVAPGVRTTWARQAVARVVPQEADDAAVAGPPGSGSG